MYLVFCLKLVDVEASGPEHVCAVAEREQAVSQARAVPCAPAGQLPS